MNRTRLFASAWLAALACSTMSHAAGLLAPTDRTLPPLRITDHAVDVRIDDQIALTTVNQTFRNDTRQRLEATYIFPLPENADLTDFQMSFNGKMVQGEVLPAEKARAIYESIVRQARDPGLIEFIGRRLLQMRVFPIEPGSETKIQVKYQQVCRPISGMSGYHYPLRTAKTSSRAHVNPEGGRAYGTVRFAVTLHARSPLKNIWSPTHSVEIVRDGEHNAKIAYEANGASLEDDFMLLYDTAEGDLGLSAIAHKPHETQPGWFVLTMTPKQLWPQQEYQPQDVVFVVDTSGSMAGEKIDQAKAALKFCIDKLDERDGFSIVRFSTGFDVFGQQIAEAGKDSKSQARAWVDKFTAAGGTNINDALKAALDLRPQAESGRPFVVVFITDGQGNQSAEDTIRLVVNHPSSKGARIFSFGVGHDVNTLLLDQLATKHAGRPTYVQPGENLELTLGDFFSVISQPVLTNLRLTLPEIGATERFPASLGDLYHGQQLIIAGRFERPATGAVKLTAMRDGREVEFSWPNVSFAHSAEAKYVPPIWAGRKIAFLLDQIRAHGENQEMVSEVIALSTEFGIQTPYTSWFVNPEERERLVRARMAPARPGGGGGGLGGGGRSGGAGLRSAAPSAQREALSSAGLPAGDDPTAPARDAMQGDGGWLVADDLGEVAGAGATEIARRNAQLRERRSADGDRLDASRLAVRKIGDRWYNRIGRYWVDETIDERTKITVVKFGSDAYFTLIERRPELRSALAAASEVALVVSDGHAVIVALDQGLEAFSDEQLQQAGLAVR